MLKTFNLGASAKGSGPKMPAWACRSGNLVDMLRWVPETRADRCLNYLLTVEGTIVASHKVTGCAKRGRTLSANEKEWR